MAWGEGAFRTGAAMASREQPQEGQEQFLPFEIEFSAGREVSCCQLELFVLFVDEIDGIDASRAEVLPRRECG